MSMNFHLKRFHISRDISEIVLHVIKQCLQAVRPSFMLLVVPPGISARIPETKPLHDLRRRAWRRRSRYCGATCCLPLPRPVDDSWPPLAAPSASDPATPHIHRSYVVGSVTEWLACWTRAQKRPGSNRSRDAVG